MRLDFLRYWIATRSKAPTAMGKGYHLVGVSVHAFTSLPSKKPQAITVTSKKKIKKRTVKRHRNFRTPRSRRRRSAIRTMLSRIIDSAKSTTLDSTKESRSLCGAVEPTARKGVGGRGGGGVEDSGCGVEWLFAFGQDRFAGEIHSQRHWRRERKSSRCNIYIGARD